MTTMANRTTLDPNSLPTTLAGSGDEVLATLLTLRPDLTTPAPRDFTELAQRVESWSSLRECLNGLDLFSQQLVEALCLLPAESTTEALLGLLGGELSPEELRAGMSRLVERMCVLCDGDRLALLPLLRRLHYPAGLGPPLADLVRQTSAGSVERIARRAGVRPGRSKAATVAALAEALGAPPLARALVEAGPPGTVELARLLAAGPPTLTVPGGSHYAGEHTPAGWLLARGLAVSDNWRGAVMPREVALALRGGRPFPDLVIRRPRPAPGPVDQRRVDGIAAGQALLTVRAVEALLEVCGRSPLPLLSSGGVGVRELRRLAKGLGRDERDTARLLELAAVTGLLGLAGEGSSAQPLPAYDAWRALELPGRWAGLVAGWQAWDCQLSVAGALDSRGRPVPALRVRSAEPFARRRRESVCAALRELPGSGADRIGLADQLRWDAPALWSDPAGAQALSGGLLEELALLGLAAQGALSTAGLLVMTGRLSEAAVLVAGHAPPVADTFVVQADLTAIVSGEPAAALRAELELLADVESTGSASVYRFSAVSLRRGFDAGRTAEDILSFLERSASRGVPQPLRYLVTDLARTFGTMRVGAARGYLRSDDLAVLAELVRSKAVARLGLRQIAPTVLVSVVEQQELVAQLRTAGFLAAAEDADGCLQITRPPVLRAVPAPWIAALAARRPGSGSCFGPVDGGLAAALDGPASGGAAPDPQTVVAGLRQRGLGGGPDPSLARVRQQLAPDTVLLFQRDGGEPPRPTATAIGLVAVSELLALACDHEWAVHLSYGSGRQELFVFPLEVDQRRMFADFLSDDEQRPLMLAQIHGVRVLSEDEEYELL